MTEYMDGGSLDRALWGSSNTTVSMSWMQRIQILLDVADGLAYLHLMQKSVHRDLKSPNILLEKIVGETVTHRAKLADFGLSKIFIKGKRHINITKETKKSSKNAISAAHWKSTTQKGFMGTSRWMAPEMMTENVQIGPSVDIYSFGVVMWEVWSGRKPWSELSNDQDIFNAVKDQRRMLPLSKTKDIPVGYDDLRIQCCEYEANRRPLIDVVRCD